MRGLVLLGSAFLMVGCAAIETQPLAAAEKREALRNPHLLNCPKNKPPVCEKWGGRARKTFAKCKCGL